jgi:ankyrin repeat domain-containing protein 17
MVAAGAGSVAVVRELLDGGADLEHVVRVTVGDSGGPRGGPDRKCHITALLHAAYCNELDAVRFLLLQGAKLGSADREAMSLVCDHLRSKASVGVPDASATLSLLRHQADAEADEEDEKAEQRLRSERARAAELKESANARVKQTPPTPSKRRFAKSRGGTARQGRGCFRSRAPGCES